MADETKYWLYQDGEIEGPFDSQELSVQPDFCPASLVCQDNGSGEPCGQWRMASSAPGLAEEAAMLRDWTRRHAPEESRPAGEAGPPPGGQELASFLKTFGFTEDDIARAADFAVEKPDLPAQSAGQAAAKAAPVPLSRAVGAAKPAQQPKFLGQAEPEWIAQLELNEKLQTLAGDSARFAALADYGGVQPAVEDLEEDAGYAEDEEEEEAPPSSRSRRAAKRRGRKASRRRRREEEPEEEFPQQFPGPAAAYGLPPFPAAPEAAPAAARQEELPDVSEEIIPPPNSEFENFTGLPPMPAPEPVVAPQPAPASARETSTTDKSDITAPLESDHRPLPDTGNIPEINIAPTADRINPDAFGAQKATSVGLEDAQGKARVTGIDTAGAQDGQNRKTNETMQVASALDAMGVRGDGKTTALGPDTGSGLFKAAMPDKQQPTQQGASYTMKVGAIMDATGIKSTQVSNSATVSGGAAALQGMPSPTIATVDLTRAAATASKQSVFKRRKLIIITAAAALALFVIVVFLYLFKGGSKPPANKDAAQSQPQADAGAAQQAGASAPQQTAAAIGIVKNYQLGGGRGTISEWLRNSYMGGQESWSATHLHGSDYVVSYKFTQQRLEPVVYEFDVNVQTGKIVRGINNAAVSLLANQSAAAQFGATPGRQPQQFFTTKPGQQTSSVLPSVALPAVEAPPPAAPAPSQPPKKKKAVRKKAPQPRKDEVELLPLPPDPRGKKKKSGSFAPMDFDPDF
ncbi:MAG: hypothetical protein WC421_02280 [Elusimicrobiales bacterium]